jgi:transcriptional regulator with GAF, ATPase, and Fis domain
MLCAAAMATKPRPAAKPRTPSTRRKPTTPEPDPTRADGRVKSKLTLAREAAALAAGRELLLATLEACGWRLTEAARTLEVASVSQVIRAIREHGLEGEYEAARVRGDIRPGKHRGAPS